MFNISLIEDLATIHTLRAGKVGWLQIDMELTTIKSIILAATVLSAAVATPTLAQTFNDQGRGSLMLERSYRSYNAYGSYGAPAWRQRGNVFDQSGRYIGSDPDPAVRDQLRRDPSQGD